MAALAIVRRDLVRYLRNPFRTAMLFAVPLMLSGIFALVFGGGGTDQISIKVLLFDEDSSLLSRLLEGAGGSSELDQKLEVVTVGPEGYEMMERGEASALVHLPKGFTRDYLGGRPTTIEVVKNPSERFLPKVVDEGVGLGAVALSVGSRVFRSELETIGGFVENEAFPADLAVASVSTGFNRKLKSLDRFLLPPVVTLETVTLIETPDGEDAPELNILAYFLPGFSVMGIFFLAQSATRDILRDRSAGLVRHLLTAPVSAADYVRGKSLSVLLVTTAGFLVLVAIGVAAGVRWGFAPAAAAMVVASAVMASGVLLLISSFVASERQGDTLATIVIMVSSMLGGAFVPISQMPSFLRPIAASTPVFWSVDGFTKLSVGGGGFADIAVNLAVLVGGGGLCMAVGSLLLQRKLKRGVV
jgi:ABC-type multidrug transport system permease subunit